MAAYGFGDDALEWIFHDLPSFPSDLDTLHTEYSAKFIPWLASLSRPPTALLVEEDSRASVLVFLLNQAGWTVPDRMSVLAICGSRRQPNSLDELSRILIPLGETFLRGLRMLHDLASRGTRTVRIEKMTAVYVPGQTCRAAEAK